jgi:antitoxin MazE
VAILTKIGNSQGVRIPKAYIKQAKLENRELEFKITAEGLLITPRREHKREGWQENIQEVFDKNRGKKDLAVKDELLNDSDLDSFEW